MTTDTDDIPMLAVGPDDLGNKFHSAVRCPKCGQAHPLEFALARTQQDDGTWSELKPRRDIAFYKCEGRSYMAGIGGMYLFGLEEAL